MVSDLDKKVNLKKYALIFGGILIFCQIVVVLITSILNFDVPAAMGIIVVVVALSTPVSLFVKEHGRVFTSGERARFATMAAIIGVVVSAALAVLSISALTAAGEPNMYQPMLNSFSRSTGFPGAVLIAGMALVSFILIWVVAYFQTGWFARRVLKTLEKSQ